MNDTHSPALLIPGAVGVAAILCTILIHVLPLHATLSLIRREKKHGHIGVRFWIDTVIVVRVISYALVAHLMEIAFWAVLFVSCGEFSDFGTAYYHSAVNYTSLGYGDLIMSPTWKLLGPLETAGGMLLFGVSTAVVFAVIQWLIEARFADLRE
jgi:hypothetical protein